MQARYFEANDALKPSLRGRKNVNHSLLDDEDFMMGVQRFLRTLEPGTITPVLLQRHVNETLLPEFQKSHKKSISLRQSRRWLYRLGYRQMRHKKGVYWDGHERKDVVKRRMEFLAQMQAIERLDCLV